MYSHIDLATEEEKNKQKNKNNNANSEAVLPFCPLTAFVALSRCFNLLLFSFMGDFCTRFVFLCCFFLKTPRDTLCLLHHQKH